ncbi:MAG: lactate utilization protein [Lachnospiraceae bacterium]|nr:lactate utilization protein [Lachnospiraceae bacterium]
MTKQQEGFALTAKSIMKELEKRNMEGFFCESSEDAVKLVLSQLPANATISWGGSETIKECGLMDALQNGNYNLLDRSKVSPEEYREFYSKVVMADAFFMSSNAITENGELVNIDGAANRLACLLHGPSNVYVIVGMNKLVCDVPAAIGRIRNVACPANTLRLNRKTPCSVTGKCGDCYSQDSICSQIVVTRRSTQPKRIKVILVAENLGY